MKAIVLSGGLGTRLRPLTLTTPKALLPLLNRPFLEYQLDLLKKYQINKVIFCLNYQPQLFRKYFRDKLSTISAKGGSASGGNYQLSTKVDYVLEKEPLGTGGAVKNAVIKKKVNEPVLIFNGDVLTDIDLNKVIDFHREKKAKVTITLTPVEDPRLYGLVETNNSGRIKNFVEKPSLPVPRPSSLAPRYTINAGIYLFEPEVFDYIPSGINYSLERGLFPLLLEKKKPMYAYIYNGYWLDVGTVEKYLQANFDLMDGKVKSPKSPPQRICLGHDKVQSPKLKAKGKLIKGKNTKVHKSVQIIGNVVIGKNCFVGENVILKDCVILDNVYIGQGAKIEDSVIGNNCRIETNAVLGPGTALGDSSVVKQYSKL